MVDILVQPDQRTDRVSIGDSPRARAWTLAVACMGVALVVASMTALNTALGAGAPAMLHDPVQIIVGRAIAGIGAAFVMPATLSLLTVAYPKDERMKAVGIWAGTAGSGGVLGLIGSGLLLRFWDWHAIFWSLSIAGMAIFVLACTVAPSRDKTAPRIDSLGAVLIGAAVSWLG
jgi:MFS family permease